MIPRHGWAWPFASRSRVIKTAFQGNYRLGCSPRSVWQVASGLSLVQTRVTEVHSAQDPGAPGRPPSGGGPGTTVRNGDREAGGRRRPMWHGRNGTWLSARYLDLDGEPQLRRHHRQHLAGPVHQLRRRGVRPGDQLPQPLAPEPAQLCWRHLGPGRVEPDAVRPGLQSDRELRYLRAEHLRPGRVLEGLRGINAVELPR